MKKKIVIITVLCLVLLSGANAFAADGFGAKGAEATTNPTIEQMLTYAIQDEYLARAEYELIIDKYGSIRPFSNIIKSEETHIDMLIPLFKTPGFPVPENTAAAHAVLPKDIKTALEIGIQAEIDNIAMYEKFLGMDLPDDVRDVFERLKNASGNHLRAFHNGLKRY